MYAVTTTVPQPLEAASPRQSERALVERHRSGDPAAFEEFYDDYGEVVFNVTYRQCGDRELAADLSQEVFVRIFKSLGRFRCQSSLKTWVYRVALNHCRSRFARRRIATVPLHGSDDPAGGVDRGHEPVDQRKDPEQRALDSDRTRTVARALRGVEASFREAVVLRDLEGLSYLEIAEVLEVPVGTVRSRIARGRQQLKRQIELGAS